MSVPLITVVIPNYNHARLLPRCLEAVLNQSVPPSEVIVLDDGSTDNSVEVLQEFTRKSPVLRLHRNERNLGVCATMNRGLALASGNYVAFLAADDQVLPGLFERVVPMLRDHPQAGAVSGLCEWRCEATGLTWYQGTRMPRSAGYVSPEEMVRLGRSGRLSVAAQHAVFHKAALIAAGGWIPELRWFTDCFSTWVVGFRLGVCHIPEVLSVFHTSPTSYYHSARSTGERREIMDRFLRLLESEAYADVAPRIRKSGVLGGLGWPMLPLVGGQRRHWSFLNLAFLRHIARRSAEVTARRLLPQGLARLCARLFYGPKGDQ